MREIIPLKKDILFKTKIGEITNINLDLDYKVSDDLIDGNVILSGTYKMTEASVLEDDFYYKIPFGVSISKRIKKDSVKIEIDDFKYNISKDILNTKIDLELTCEEEKEEVKEVKEETDDLSEYFKDEVELENNLVEENKITTTEEKNDIDIEENINNITNTFINNENKYYTYKVYIVRSGDTIESICNKYNISIDDIKEYNNLNEINVGDKIIIPQINE